MPRKSKKHTVPEHEIYQNGIFHFNITEMTKFIKEDEAKTLVMESVEVESTRSGFTNNINEEHLDSVDVTIPIILAKISPENYNVIDGNH